MAAIGGPACGHKASAWVLRRWGYRMVSMAGKIVSDGRQRRLLIPVRAREARLLCPLNEGVAVLFRGGGMACWPPEMVVSLFLWF